MINWQSNIVCWLFLVVSVVVVGIVAGCQQEYKQEPEAQIDVFVVEPNLVVESLPDYASRAIEATGGRQAWTEAKSLRLDCVVTFYKSDGSFYLTEQDYEIYPWSNSIRISATEPQGNFVWELSRGGLEGGGSWHTGVGFPVELCSKQYFAELILDITTAPVRFLDKSVVFTKGPKPVKKEGLWYYPIERSDLELYEIMKDGPKVIFYQNRSTFLVDMLWFAGVDSPVIASEAQPSVAIPISLAVRGYDYRELEKGGVRVPTKIEIFRTDAVGVLRERLVKIDSK